MHKSKYLPLTETVYYILLSLIEPAHGYIIMQNIDEMSGGSVKMAAGTLYGAIENLLKLKFIQQEKSEDKRRKVYALTALGKEVLLADMQRMQHLVELTQEKVEDIR